MKNYLALSKESLSKITYHWFWGIVSSVEGESNFSKRIEELQSDPDELNTINSQIQEMKSALWLIEKICWLFNWDDYCKHYYELQAYLSHELYQQRIFGMEKGQQEKAKGFGAFFLSMKNSIVGTWDSIKNAFGSSEENIDILPTDSTSLLAEFSVNEIPIVIEQSNDLSLVPLVNNPKKPTALRSAPVSLTEAEFIVTEEMIEPLSKLGFKCEQKQVIKFEELKKRYREVLLQTHPDKGGDKNNFQEIKAAYDLLQHIFNQARSQGSKFVSSFAREMHDFNEMLAEAMRNNEKLKSNFDEYRSQVSSYFQSADEFMRNVEEFNVLMEQDKEKVDAHVGRVDAHVGRVDAHVILVNAHVNRVNECKRELEELKRRVENQTKRIDVWEKTRDMNLHQTPDLTAGIGEGGVREVPGQEAESVKAVPRSNRNSLNAFFKKVESSLVGGNNPMSSSENNKNANFIPKGTE